MARQEVFDPHEAVKTSKERKTATIEEYLSRFPQHQYSAELNQIKQKLSRLNSQDLNQSLYFPASTKKGNGIYVQGPRVTAKNVLPQSFNFYIDDVSFIIHYAKATFLFLVIGWSMTRANAVVFLDKNHKCIGSIQVGSIKTRDLRSFLTHLVSVNPAIRTDSHILKFISGTSGVFAGRVLQKLLVSILCNIAVYAIIILIISALP